MSNIEINAPEEGAVKEKKHCGNCPEDGIDDCQLYRYPSPGYCVLDAMFEAGLEEDRKLGIIT